MKTTNFLASAMIASTLLFVGCSPRDADIQAAIQAKEAAPITVSVIKGDVTLTGEVPDEMSKTKAEEIAKGEKGVKSVINSLTIKPAQAIVIADDATLIKNVADATKDYPSVTAVVNDGVITLRGEIKQASLVTLMQQLSALNPKKINNDLTVK